MKLRTREATRSGPLFSRLKNDRFVRNNVIYFVGSVGAGTFGYVFHFAVGRLLGPVQYSVVASALSALYLLALPSLVIQTVSMRFASIAAASEAFGQVRRLWIRLSGVSLLAGVGVGAALIFGGSRVTHFLQLGDQRVVLIVGVATVLGTMIAVNRGILQGLRRFGMLSLNLVLDTSSRVVFGVVLVVAGFGILGPLFTLVLGPALAYSQSLLILSRLHGHRRGDYIPLVAVGQYAIPTAVAVIGITYLFNLDVLLAKHFLSPHDAGIYAAASVLARVIYFLGLTVAGVMFPEVATLNARNERHFHVVDLSLLFIAFLGAVLIGLYVIAPGLVLLPYGRAFVGVTPLLGTFAVALTLLAVANLLVNYFLSINSFRFVVPLSAACLLETLLIVSFHRGPAQILEMVLLSMGSLALVLGGLYALERLRTRA